MSTVGKKLRTFKIAYAEPHMERVNEMMRRFDVGWGPEDGACEKGTITSYTTLSVDEYRKGVADAFAKIGARLYDFYEVVRTEAEDAGSPATQPSEPPTSSELAPAQPTDKGEKTS